MTELTVKNERGTAVATQPPGNPDGKGANGFMLDWYRTEPRGLVAKPQRQVLAEFFTSMLILSASFKYKPAIGVNNYLYRVDDQWMLSLIAPEQWSEKHRRGFVGNCVLQADQTWTIEPSEELMEFGPLKEAVSRFFDAFAEKMDTDLTLEEILPFYVRGLPYWQRLHASALSRSIRGAVRLGGQASIRARDWRLALPGSGETLLLGDA
ncbi:MAG: DUF2452 domain-containing protein [Woeseiaceae bacterium]|nr:DUF2452 domain-containing protein [Woeseiaceae bacterium]